MRSIRPFNRRGERGMVLVLVLLIIMVLAVILLEFSYEANLEVEIAGSSRRSEQALNCADAGAGFALAVLRQNPGALQDDTLRPLLTGDTPILIGDGQCKVVVEVENGRLDVNALATAGGVLDRMRVEQMIRLVDLLNAQGGMQPPISYTVVASMIDWTTDSDDVTTLPWVKGDNDGAKNDYYQGLTPPCLCKCAPFDTLDELLRVRDVTPFILNGVPADAAANAPAIQGLRGLLTCYGDGKVDINSAPALVLQALSPDIDDTLAQTIISQRSQAPFKQPMELLLIPDFPPAVYAAISNYITVAPDNWYYRIAVTATVDGIERRVREVIKLNNSQAAQGAPGDATVLLRQEP